MHLLNSLTTIVYHDFRQIIWYRTHTKIPQTNWKGNIKTNKKPIMPSYHISKSDYETDSNSLSFVLEKFRLYIKTQFFGVF